MVFFRRKLIGVNRGLIVMNIQMSTFRLQLTDRHSTFLTVLVEGDNQIRQPVCRFSWKSFHTQSQKYLLVSYEFSISRSSKFEPASHRISHPSFTRVPSSFLFYFLYVSIENCDFVSPGSPERHIRNCSFKREMKISRLNLYLFFSDLSWEFPFVYRKPEKKAIFNVFCSFELSR